MTCILPRPSPQVLFDRISAQFSANVLGGGPILPRSNEAFVVANEYLSKETYYSLSEQQWREQDDRYCCADNLTKRAAMRGVFPRPATFAKGYVTVTGKPGSSLSTSMRFTIGANDYVVDTGSTMPSSLDASGAAIVQVVATTSGVAANTLGVTGATALATGALSTPLPGINTTVTSCGSTFCNGAAAESVDEFRARYLARLAYQPNGDFQLLARMMMEWPCVTRICVRNCTCCTNQYELQAYPMFDNTFPNGIAPQTVIDDMQRWFFGEPQGHGFGRAPINVYGKLFMPRAAVFNVAVHGLACISADQLQMIKTRIVALSKRHCPSDTVGIKTYETMIAQVTGDPELATVYLDIATPGSGLVSDDCGDILPDCDVLPVLGTINIPSAAC